MIDRMFILLVSAVAILLGSAEMCVASTRTIEHPTPFVSKRIHRQQQQQQRLAFSRTTTHHHHQQQQNEPSTAPLTSPLTGWITDFTNAVRDDFAATANDSNHEILHECVVNYRKGLVGNF